MSKFHLKTPFSDEDVRQLKVGDIVHFDGTLFGIRDLTQIYMVDQNHEPPVSLEGMPCIHTSPSLKKVGDKWEPICVGTTTSVRMDRYSPLLFEKYGVRAIYLAIVGGAAALETQQIEEVEAIYWEHLHPEALYQFRVKDFGPLTVAMDAHGNHQYFSVKAEAKRRLPEIYKKLGVS
jgi:L(+)-tartrate dehydratase beta subunit